MTVQKIASQRETIATLESERDVIQQRIDESPLGLDWRNRHDAVKQAKEKLKILEDGYREDGIAEYFNSGTTKFEGGEVKIRKVFEYVDFDASEWIIDHKHFNLFNIDRKKFLSVAKGLDLDFVATIEKPTFYLSKDLSEFLDEINEE